jgi:LysR family transcriptional regulator, hydrogen peroxide-inducible genes activator
MKDKTLTHDLDSRLSVRQLECIVAVAEALSFRRAADNLRLAQPALSTHVASAEALLRCQLFERDRRSVLVTALGRDVVAAARIALQALDSVSDIARCGSEPLTGSLRMGVIPTIAPYWLQHLLPGARKQFPKLMLILREDQTQRLLDQLSAGEIDVALLALPVSGDFTAMTVCDEEFVLASARKQGQTPRRKIRPEDLVTENMLLLADGHCLRDQALAVCTAGYDVAKRHNRGGSPEAASTSMSVQATSLPTLIQMVAGGLGATLLPEASVDALVPHRKSGVMIEHFAKPAPSRRIGLLWRTSSGRLREFRLLGETLASHAAAHLAVLLSHRATP